jgi:hypothetical protein
MVATSLLFEDQKPMRYVILVETGTNFGVHKFVYGPYKSERKARKAIQGTHLPGEIWTILPLETLD